MDRPNCIQDNLKPICKFYSDGNCRLEYSSETPPPCQRVLDELDELDELEKKEVLGELEKYRALEEKGRLITLPCSVGDKVYKICPINKKIHFGDMRNGKIVESDCQRCPYGNCGCSDIGFQKGADNIVRELVARNEGWIWNRRDYFGTIYFLTRAEAVKFLDQKLKQFAKEES